MPSFGLSGPPSGSSDPPCGCVLFSCPVRVQIRLIALVVWLLLSLPSILVTLGLYFMPVSSIDSGETNITQAAPSEVETNNVTYACYENYTIYEPLYEQARFWIEGVLLFGVGLCGLLGNILTLAVLRKSKSSKFNQLLIFLSVTDIILIIFFCLIASCTVLSQEPQWFIVIFPYVLWPLGNIAITASVLMVVAVSTERYLAICRPLQYKPSPGFYVTLVMLISVAVNTGKFLEYKLVYVEEDNYYYFSQTFLMADERYIVFSRYWTEIIVIGILPLVALILLNYGIYSKIRKSTKFRKLHNKPSSLAAGQQSARNPLNRFNSSQAITNNTGSTRYMGAEATPLRNPANAPVKTRQTTGSVSEDNNACNSTKEASNNKGSGNGERSTKFLVGIVFVFLVCHVFRLVVQIDAVVHPSIMGKK